MTKRLISLLLVCMMMMGLAAACGQPAGDSTAPVSIPQVLAPNEDPSEPEKEPEPEPEPEPLFQKFLTGEEKDASYPEDMRMTAVMVGNDPGARPHRGFSEAKVVVEITVEYYITRFMAIFEDYHTIDEVGPMRSMRDQFLQLVLPFQAYVIHDGPAGEVPTNWMLRDYNYEPYDLRIAGAWRDQARLAAGVTSTFTEFTGGEAIAAYVENNGYGDKRVYGESTLFNFVPYTQPARVPGEGSIERVGVTHQASFRTLFDYDAASGKYQMSQFNSSRGTVEENIDENNGQRVAFDNLVVLFAPIPFYNASPLPKVDYYGGGGFYISKGGFERILWFKGAADQPLRLEKIDGSGEPVQVNTGNTYLAVVNEENAEDFYAGLLDGTSYEMAAAGVKNTSLQEAED